MIVRKLVRVSEVACKREQDMLLENLVQYCMSDNVFFILFF